MTHAHAIWALTCLATAFGVNHLMKPRAVPVYDEDQLTRQTGKVTLQLPDGPREIPLIDVQLSNRDIEVFDRVRSVREMRWRSPVTGDEEPATRLTASFEHIPGLPQGRTFDALQLKGAELKLMPHGFGGERPSWVDVGGEEPGKVVDGTVTLIEVLPFDAGSGQPSWRVTGRMVLQVDTPRAIQSYNGRFNARVVWEADRPAEDG